MVSTALIRRMPIKENATFTVIPCGRVVADDVAGIKVSHPERQAPGSLFRISRAVSVPAPSLSALLEQQQAAGPHPPQRRVMRSPSRAAPFQPPPQESLF